MNKYNIPEDPKMYSKLQWKKLCKSKISEKNKYDILESVRSYKKLSYDKLSKEKFEIKGYLKKMAPADARLKFSLRARMTRTVQTNYKGDPVYSKNKWLCVECSNVDTQEHVIVCPNYANLRIGKDLEKDEDLVRYFRNVIAVREARYS